MSTPPKPIMFDDFPEWKELLGEIKRRSNDELHRIAIFLAQEFIKESRFDHPVIQDAIEKKLAWMRDDLSDYELAMEEESLRDRRDYIPVALQLPYQIAVSICSQGAFLSARWTAYWICGKHKTPQVKAAKMLKEVKNLEIDTRIFTVNPIISVEYLRDFYLPHAEGTLINIK